MTPISGTFNASHREDKAEACNMRDCGFVTGLNAVTYQYLAVLRGGGVGSDILYVQLAEVCLMTYHDQLRCVIPTLPDVRLSSALNASFSHPISLLRDNAISL